MKKYSGQFIRQGLDGRKTNEKACYRKTLQADSTISSLELSIWADSRYYLWINNSFIGTGPLRSWPDYPEKDCYSFKPDVDSSELQLAVLVWHFGTSTSQYVDGPAGLAVTGSYIDINGECRSFSSDESWKVRQHEGYLSPVPRINVSQPQLEILDARAFPEDWMTFGFDDSSWQAAVICPQDSLPTCRKDGLEMIPERDIPLLASVKKYPAAAVAEDRILCKGIGVRIDYKNAFYPADTTTEDRLQTGYLCCVIDSPVTQLLRFTLADRIWPERDEYVHLNGRRFILPPLIHDIELCLEKGENLFLIDVSGARQRFSTDMHFGTEMPISFKNPLKDSEAVFTAVGPFDTTVIGNIVCADGFSVDEHDPDFICAGLCRTAAQLSVFNKKLHPVFNVLLDGVKLRTIGADKYKPETVKPFPGQELLLGASSEEGDHEIILDMGEEVSGFLCFTINAEGGSEIDIRFFEYLTDKGPEIPDDLDTSLRYICSEGESGYRSLVRRGFRYIAIRSRAGKDVRISGLHIDERLFPFNRQGIFLSGDAELDDIWKICRRTIELCSEDTVVDCPAFEQAFWIGDANVTALYQQYLFGETALIRHCLILAARSMNYTELPDCHLPAGVHLLLTAWAQLWILACRDYWMHTGEIDFLQVIYPWIEKASEAFYGYIGDDGLLDIAAWNMLDWAPMDTPYRGKVAHLNARLAACFDAASELAGVLKLNDECELWKERAVKLAADTDKAFFDENRGIYIDCIHEDGRRSDILSVQTNLMMMIYGCVPAARKNRINSFILAPPEEAVKPGSPFVAHFYYDYLFSLGRGAEAIEGIREQWLPMLEQGSCWETFKGFYKDRLTRSYCHGWSSAPAYLFGAWVLGIRPAEPGFKKIIIAPQCSGLSHAEGRVPVPAGFIYVSWKIADSVLHCRVKLPAGTEYLFEPKAEGWDESKLEIEEYQAGEET